MSNKMGYKKFIDGAEQLSLGISIVVAILLGVGIGLLMRDWFEQDWLLWIGILWGIGGAGLNIKKAYEKQKKELDKLKDDPKYKDIKYDDSE
jgi:F0F1-type ATP synthase assembly protein I